MDDTLCSPGEEVSGLEASALSVPEMCERGQESRMVVEGSVRYGSPRNVARFLLGQSET